MPPMHTTTRLNNTYEVCGQIPHVTITQTTLAHGCHFEFGTSNPAQKTSLFSSIPFSEVLSFFILFYFLFSLKTQLFFMTLCTIRQTRGAIRLLHKIRIYDAWNRKKIQKQKNV